MEQAVRNFYELLQNQSYDEIVRLTNATRLKAREIERCISEYGCELAPYPAAIELDTIFIEGSDPRKWSVIAPVFTVEEGLSDLSIELTVTDTGDDNYLIELDDIHVR